MHLLGRNQRLNGQGGHRGIQFRERVRRAARVFLFCLCELLDAGFVLCMSAPKCSNQDARVEELPQSRSSRTRFSRSASINSGMEMFEDSPWYTQMPNSFFNSASWRIGRKVMRSPSASTSKSSPASTRIFSRSAFGRTTRPALSMDILLATYGILAWLIPFENGFWRGGDRAQVGDRLTVAARPYASPDHPRPSSNPAACRTRRFHECGFRANFEYLPLHPQHRGLEI